MRRPVGEPRTWSTLSSSVSTISAKPAVERHLGQGALKNGKLLVVQFRDKEIEDAAHVDRSCFGQAVQTGVGQHNGDPTRVAIGSGSTNQAVVNQSGDPPRHAR